MIKHFLKLMWNRKRRNSILLIEIIVSFLILFAISSMIIFNYSNLNQDLGYNYKNVWCISFDWEDEEELDVIEKLNQIKSFVQAKKEIKSSAYVEETYPFSFSLISTTYDDKYEMEYFECEPECLSLLEMNLLEGRFFNEMDYISNKKPLLINKKCKEKYFSEEKTLGFTLEDKYEIIGVFDNYRYANSYMSDKPTVIQLYHLNDTSNKYLMDHMLIKVTDQADRKFEAQLMNDLSKLTHGWKIEINWLEDEKVIKDKAVWIPVMILVIISVFLVLNVALGIFGLLWYNISKRKAEIGLRRAVGATVKNISRQVTIEMFVLSSFAIFIGLLITIHFPIFAVFNIEPSIYVFSIISSITILLTLIYLCTLFPGKQATKIQPAEALHDD
jgi:putative ABC transport system permease protein